MTFTELSKKVEGLNKGYEVLLSEDNNLDVGVFTEDIIIIGEIEGSRYVPIGKHEIPKELEELIKEFANTSLEDRFND